MVDLHPVLAQAAAAGGRAAARAGKSVKGDISGGALTFTGPGAKIARAAALAHLQREAPRVAQSVREQYVRALERR